MDADNSDVTRLTNSANNDPFNINLAGHLMVKR